MSEIKKNLVEKLLAGVCTFVYVKKNGEERVAKGTLNSKLFTYESKGTGKPCPEDMVRYWDLDKNGFRSFHVSQLVSVA